MVSTLVGAYAWRGPENGNLTFQRCVAIDAKRQQTGLIKDKTEFGRDDPNLGHDHLP